MRIYSFNLYNLAILLKLVLAFYEAFYADLRILFEIYTKLLMLLNKFVIAFIHSY